MERSKAWARGIGPIVLALLLLLKSGEALAQYQLRSDGFSALGGAISSASQKLLAVGGQPQPIGTSSNSAHILNAGFIPTLLGDPPPEVATIKPEVTSPQQIGAEFIVDIRINDVQSLFGVSFELNYANTAILDGVEPVLPGDFLGSGSEILFIARVDDAAGKVSIGISRTAGQGVNGSGVVARVKFKSLASTPPGTSVVFSFSNVAANDPGGNSINLMAINATLTLNAGLIVWPGDTNNDGIANQADVLPLGQLFEKTGPERPNASLIWIGQPATPWSPERSTYADANGNGVVNQADVLAIGLNFGKTHALAGQQPLAKGNSISSAASLKPDVNPRQQAPGKEFFIKIRALEVTDLFGVSFELIYDRPGLVQILAVEPDSLLGSEVIFFSNMDAAGGKVSVGITKTSGQTGANGAGSVVRLKAVLTAQAKNGDLVNLSLQNVLANNSAGQALQMMLQASHIEAVISTTVVAKNGTQLVADYRLHQNYPNPFLSGAKSRMAGNPETLIQYEIPQAGHVVVKIYNAVGQEVRTLMNAAQQLGAYQISWDGRDEQGRTAPSGIYLYRLQAGSFVRTQKMVLMR